MLKAMNKPLAKFVRRQGRVVTFLFLLASVFIILYVISTRESLDLEGSETLEQLTTPQYRSPLDSKTKQRREAVIRTFQHAWGGYKAFAWGEDELLPLSKKGTKRFLLGGMIADVLDTMILMGLKEEIAQACCHNRCSMRMTAHQRVAHITGEAVADHSRRKQSDRCQPF